RETNRVARLVMLQGVLQRFWLVGALTVHGKDAIVGLQSGARRGAFRLKTSDPEAHVGRFHVDAQETAGGRPSGTGFARAQLARRHAYHACRERVRAVAAAHQPTADGYIRALEPFDGLKISGLDLEKSEIERLMDTGDA